MGNSHGYIPHGLGPEHTFQVAATPIFRYESPYNWHKREATHAGFSPLSRHASIG